MTNYIIAIIIFLILLLLYLHFRFHLKKIHTNEIIYIDSASKIQFENACNSLQPFIYNYSITPEEENYNIDDLKLNFESYDIKLYKSTNFDDYNIINLNNIDSLNNHNDSSSNDISTNDISLNNEYTSNSSYLSYNNEFFLKDTDIYNSIKKNDKFLKPSYCNWSNYDIIFGKNISTPLFSSNCNRNFFHCTENNVECAIISFKYSNFFDSEKYKYYMMSNLPIFNSEKILANNQWKKIKPIFITLNKGDCLFLPSYWYCAFNFKNESTIIKYNYSTFMNNTIFLKDKVEDIINNTLCL